VTAAVALNVPDPLKVTFAERAITTLTQYSDCNVNAHVTALIVRSVALIIVYKVSRKRYASHIVAHIPTQRHTPYGTYNLSVIRRHR